MEADDGKPNHVEDKENAMDGTTTNVIFFSHQYYNRIYAGDDVSLIKNTFLKQL